MALPVLRKMVQQQARCQLGWTEQLRHPSWVDHASLAWVSMRFGAGHRSRMSRVRSQLAVQGQCWGCKRCRQEELRKRLEQVRPHWQRKRRRRRRPAMPWMVDLVSWPEGLRAERNQPEMQERARLQGDERARQEQLQLR